MVCVGQVVRFKRATGRTIERVIVRLDCDDAPYVNADASKKRCFFGAEQIKLPSDYQLIGTEINGQTIELPDFAEPCESSDLPQHYAAMQCGCCKSDMLPQDCKPATSWRSRYRRSVYSQDDAAPANVRRYASGRAYLFVGQVCQTCADQVRNRTVPALPMQSELASYLNAVESGAIPAPYAAEVNYAPDTKYERSERDLANLPKKPVKLTPKLCRIVAAVAESQARCNYRNLQRMEENAAKAKSLNNWTRDRYGRRVYSPAA